MKLKMQKCEFWKEKTECLGHALTNDGIKPNLKRDTTVRNIPGPADSRQVLGSRFQVIGSRF